MIIITGCPRSGTTLTSQVFQACGADFGKVNALMESPSNKRSLKNSLGLAGFDALAQRPLPEAPLTPLKPINFPDEIHKECKIVFFWEWVHDKYPDAKWVIVRRSQSEIASSCMRTPFMIRYKEHKDWFKMIRTYEKHMEDMKAHVDFREVWPKKFKSDPDDPMMKDAVEWAGYTWDEDKARSAIKGSLLR